MATQAQIKANRRNAARSTGPKTQAGLARSAQNSYCHGVYSTSPVLPEVERTEDWEAHRDGIFQSLAPVGCLEESFAGRVALCLWRLGRVVRYETAASSIHLQTEDDPADPNTQKVLWRDRDKSCDAREEAPPPVTALYGAGNERKRLLPLTKDLTTTFRLLKQLGKKADADAVDSSDVFVVMSALASELKFEDEDSLHHYLWGENGTWFFTVVGIPKDYWHEPLDRIEWTAGWLRTALDVFANDFKVTRDILLAKLPGILHAFSEKNKAAFKTVEAEIRDLRRNVGHLTERRMLPSEATLQKVARYESHLSKQMYQALHELQRLQVARRGGTVSPPLALDMTLEHNVAA